MSYKLKIAIKYLKYIGLVALTAFAVSMVFSGLVGTILCGCVGFILGRYIQDAIMWEVSRHEMEAD